MKNFKKVIILVIVFALCFSTLMGCEKKEDVQVGTSGAQSTEGSKDGKEDEVPMDKEQVFKYSDNSDITGLNPMLNTTGPDNGVHDFVFETLVKEVTDEKGNTVILPAAAEEWKVSPDGTVYTFKIRENAAWSDGVPVIADRKSVV